ncbi:MAG: prevent-host-death family protein [Gammaproteobacteria bacterium RIFCSPHIGHO2_12_FULL_37_34]|nr:MAG: prevent-host-death family protein [Gammaproteobacteria bacterium RIFCSPHIGHO2_12_FULL_37_34]
MTIFYINTTDAKEEFSELIHRVFNHKERIILTRRDKEIAAIVPLEDLLLIQASQNKSDLNEAVEALKEARKQGATTLEKLKEEVG